MSWLDTSKRLTFIILVGVAGLVNFENARVSWGLVIPRSWIHHPGPSKEKNPIISMYKYIISNCSAVKTTMIILISWLVIIWLAWTQRTSQWRILLHKFITVIAIIYDFPAIKFICTMGSPLLWDYAMEICHLIYVNLIVILADKKNTILR